MVSGRAGNAEDPVRLPGRHRVNGPDTRAGGQTGHRLRRGAEGRVAGGHVAVSPCAPIRDRIEVPGIVHGLDPGFIGNQRGKASEAVRRRRGRFIPGQAQPGKDGGHAFRPFGMEGTRVVQQEVGVGDQRGGHVV